jgi:hypothetical protein
MTELFSRPFPRGATRKALDYIRKGGVADSYGMCSTEYCRITGVYESKSERRAHVISGPPGSKRDKAINLVPATRETYKMNKKARKKIFSENKK